MPLMHWSMPAAPSTPNPMSSFNTTGRSSTSYSATLFSQYASMEPLPVVHWPYKCIRRHLARRLFHGCCSRRYSSSSPAASKGHVQRSELFPRSGESSTKKRSKALNHLRQSLSTTGGSNATSETSILCVALLLAAEAILGDDVGLRSHTRGLSQLVAGCGGIRVLSSLTASIVRFVDVKASIARRRAPQFDVESYNKHQAYYDSSFKVVRSTSDEDIMNFGRGFMEPELQNLLCPALLRCVIQIKFLTLDSLKTSKGDQLAAAYDIDDFVALEHSLLSIKGSHRLSPLEECVRLALLLFTNTALWRIPLFFTWIRSPVADLKLAMLLLDQERSHEDCTNLFL